MQLYFELVPVDWKGLKLPSGERRQRDGLESFERSVEVWKDWIRLKKESQHLVKSCLQRNRFPAKRKEQSPDPTKRDASREEFRRRVLSGGNMLELLSCLLVSSIDTFGKF